MQYPAVPGEQLTIPVTLVNQGLAPDTFQLGQSGLPQSWVASLTPALRLDAGEETTVFLAVQPPRLPEARAGRTPFTILVSSQAAPDQSVSIDCTLTVAAFIEFKSFLEAEQPDQSQPARVRVQNSSNIPVSFRLTWSSPEDAVTFEPPEPQQINVAPGESGRCGLHRSSRQAPVVGGREALALLRHRSGFRWADPQAGFRPAHPGAGTRLGGDRWRVGAVARLPVSCRACIVARVAPDLCPNRHPHAHFYGGCPAPTATLSRVDQRALLVERTWYLAAYNDQRSSPGVQEAFTLFNPNGTLIGYTGCKDLSANYQTNYNQITITGINLGPGTCPDATLQEQEGAMVAILRAARSYTVADTVLQIAGDAGFLSYSLTPLDRPAGVTPPQAAIQVVPQAQVGQVVVFDGSASSGQAPLVAWNWDFGDGATASGVVVQHTYTTAGTFTVRLTVTDQRNQTGTTTTPLHILALPTPTLTPTAPPPTATPPLPTLPPQQPTYTPAPTAEPPTATPEPPPAPVPPVASISGPGQGYIGEPVRFDASASQPGSSPITSYSWSLGNGVDLPASAQSSISATYNRAGSYEVTVFVNDAEGLSSFATTRIRIDARLDTSVWTLAIAECPTAAAWHGDYAAVQGRRACRLCRLQYLYREIHG